MRAVFSLLAFSLLITTTTFAGAFHHPPTIGFSQGYTPLFGDFNILRWPDDRTVSLLLNRHSVSGFLSSDYYNYGLFGARIELPSNYTAGIVVAFYEIRGRPWWFQTNLSGNGSTSRGREERYTLWFDPTQDFHCYSILWTSTNIIFYVDEVPIREVKRSEAMGGDYPSKPMSLYATIWKASNWASEGGKYKVNYNYQPFAAHFTDLVLQGCAVHYLQQAPTVGTQCSDVNVMAAVTPAGQKAMSWFREKYMDCSYCYDAVRYPEPPPEFVVLPAERRRFKDTGRLREGLRMRFRRPLSPRAGG
ncbi:Xyloglucan:xyloglucosyl transferase [Bertholletia excelsa]